MYVFLGFILYLRRRNGSLETCIDLDGFPSHAKAAAWTDYSILCGTPMSVRNMYRISLEWSGV